jgi:hypothetical protein
VRDSRAPTSFQPDPSLSTSLSLASGELFQYHIQWTPC